MLNWHVKAPCVHLDKDGLCSIYEDRPAACRESYSEKKDDYFWYDRCMYSDDEDRYDDCQQCGGRCCMYVVVISYDTDQHREYWTSRGAELLDD